MCHVEAGSCCCCAQHDGSNLQAGNVLSDGGTYVGKRIKLRLMCYLGKELGHVVQRVCIDLCANQQTSLRLPSPDAKTQQR
jgi:hypothetical protein